jgi:dihydropyrimidinase
MFPKKGTIAPGSDADIVIFNPDKVVTLSHETLHMNVDFNPYEGREVVGYTETVLSRGVVVVKDGKFCGTPGSGKFVRRSPRSQDL